MNEMNGKIDWGNLLNVWVNRAIENNKRVSVNLKDIDTNVIGGMSKNNSKYMELVIYENPINEVVFSEEQIDWEVDNDDTED